VLPAKNKKKLPSPRAKGPALGDTDERAPRTGRSRCLLKIKKLLSPRAKGTALGEGPLFTESKTLTECCFHQILSKNSK
jgi:hypothetical protein